MLAPMRVPMMQLNCPNCSGRIHFDTDTGNYDCANGHTFAEEPSGAPAVQQSESRTLELAAVAQVETAERGPSLAPPPSAPVAVVEASEPAAPSVDLTPQPPPRPAAAASSGPRLADLLAQQPPVRCANGDWLVVVRVPEVDAITLIAEAESQRRTFGDYFQRAVSYALSQDWLRNAGN